MISTFRKRFDVMHFFYRNNDSSLKALLTKWMLFNIVISYSFPYSSVPTAYSRIPVILLVAFVLLSFMLLAEPTVS